MPDCSLCSLGAFLDSARLMAGEQLRLAARIAPLTQQGAGFGGHQDPPAVDTGGRSRRPGDFDYVAVVGSASARQADLSPTALQLLHAAKRDGATLIGIASGTLALAQAGLLPSGAHVCVPASLAALFRQRFADLRVASGDRSFVEDARLITSLGEASTTDLVLHLVRQHFGTLAAESLCAKLQLTSTGSSRAPVQSRSQRAVHLMQSHFADVLPIDVIARQLNISARQLHREFLRELGASPTDYYRRLRVRHGLWLLQNTNKGVTQISQETGFADGPHFSRTLFRELGMTPRQVRQVRAPTLQPVPRMAPREVVRWRVGVPHGINYAGYHILVELARRVCARTEGRFLLDIVPFRQMGLHCSDTLRAVETGNLDAVWVVPEYCTDEPLLNAMVPQGLLADPMTNLRIAEIQYAVLRKILMRRDLDVAATPGDIGERELVLLSRRPINSLDQLRGCRLRHWSSFGAHAFDKLGVSTTTAPPSRCLDSLAEGEVDAVLGLPSLFVARGAHRVGGFVSRSIAVTRNYPYVVATKRGRLDTLPDYLRTMLWETGEQMHRESEYLWHNDLADERFMGHLKDGGVEAIEPFSGEDRSLVEAAMKSSWSEHCAALGPDAITLHDEIAAVLQ
jgi:transcriptional regulator GlxA family with amidase domain/TRAP-type C4-dicarboxylate transport system substrate-binding protein